MGGMEQLSEKAGREAEKESGAWVRKGGTQQGIAACRAKRAQECRCGSQPGVAAQLTKVGTATPQQPHRSCHLQLLGML